MPDSGVRVAQLRQCLLGWLRLHGAQQSIAVHQRELSVQPLPNTIAQMKHILEQHGRSRK